MLSHQLCPLSHTLSILFQSSCSFRSKQSKPPWVLPFSRIPTQPLRILLPSFHYFFPHLCIHPPIHPSSWLYDRAISWYKISLRRKSPTKLCSFCYSRWCRKYRCDGNEDWKGSGYRWFTKCSMPCGHIGALNLLGDGGNLPAFVNNFIPSDDDWSFSKKWIGHRNLNERQCFSDEDFWVFCRFDSHQQQLCFMDAVQV